MDERLPKDAMAEKVSEQCSELEDISDIKKSTHTIHKVSFLYYLQCPCILIKEFNALE